MRDSKVVEARDIAGISVPFSAGVATGAVLCPFLSGGLPFITSSILLALICLTTLLVRFGTSTSSVTVSDRRIAFAGIFIIAGIFCSLNHSLASGIPEYDNGLIGLAAADAVGTLRNVIDNIPYPSETTGPLVKALLTGDKSDLTKEITEIFRASGASPILALSGLHLGVL